MKFKFLRLMLAVVSGFAAQVQAEEYIVRFIPSSDKSSAESTLESNGFEVMKTIPQLNMYVAQPSSNKGAADMDGLQKSAGVIYVEPNYTRRAIAVPNDKSYSSQKGMRAMGIERAWDFNQGSKSVIVAVIDTGISLNHVDLKNQLWVNPGEIPGNGIDDDKNGFIDDVHGWDFVGKDGDPTDDQNHGSHCAGIIGAETNNGTGIAGVNWNVQLMAVKFLNSAGSGSDADAILSIIYAVENGAHIINASWGSTDYSQAVLDAVNFANARGVLFVAAAGNASENAEKKPHYPSGYDTPNMVAVGATNDNKGKADFSNYGRTRVHLAAPGVNIFSTIAGKNSYAKLSGTSMATPMVAGVAALLFSANPAFGTTELRNALLNAVEPVKAWSDNNATNGFLRADWALEQLGAGPQLWPKYLRLAVDHKHSLTAYGIAHPNFASSDESVITVNAQGEVVAVGSGVATVKVTDSVGTVHSAQIEVVENKKSGGGGCASENGAIAPETSEASTLWIALLFMLPLILRGFIQKTRWR